MKKNIFAICDLEPAYLGNLTDYISRRGSLPFELHAFTNREALMDFAKENEIELLLISASAYVKALEGLPIGKIVLLCEGELPQGLSKGEYTQVYKYQSCAGILKETMAAYGEARAVPLPLAVAKRLSRTYGVYSPAGGCGCTSLALALGMELSRRMPTLFVTLEGCSGLGKLLGLSSEHSLGDLLYFARQRDATLSSRAVGMVQTVEGLDLLPPVALSEDIHQLEEGDMDFFLSQMSSASAYEAFVLDLGRQMPGIPALMARCDKIFVPQRKDPFFPCKMEEFLQSLLTLGEEEAVKKLEPVLVPPLPGMTGALASALLWGGVGDVARELLREEGFDGPP